MMNRTCVAAMLLLALGSTPASADPKPEAVDAMKWGLQYCLDALNPNRGISEVEENHEKFRKKLAIAVAADPSIRNWSGTLRGMKVNEGIAKCEKEIPARLAGDKHKLQSEADDRAIMTACAIAVQPTASTNAWDDYQKLKATQLKNRGKFSANVNAELVRCEKAHGEKVEAHEQQLKERAAQNAKFEEEQAETRKKQKLAAKKLRASLKGDRGKIYDRYGSPTTWEGDLSTTSEWSWVLGKTRNGIEASCWTTVRFKGNKKVGERQDGEACRW